MALLSVLCGLFLKCWALSFQFQLQRWFLWDAGIGPELPSRAAVLKVWSSSISDVWNLLEMQILGPTYCQILLRVGPANCEQTLQVIPERAKFESH